MAKINFEIEEPRSVSGFTLVPIVEIRISMYQGAAGIYYAYSRKPLAVIFISSDGCKALAISGEELPLDSLQKDIPGLSALLEQHC